jgi:hypothetical protein
VPGARAGPGLGLSANELLRAARGQGLAQHDVAIVVEALRRPAGGT